MTDEKLQTDFRKLSKALERLEKALNEPEWASRSLQTTAEAFEYAMDYFWKVAKELLTARGIETHMPREAVQHAYERGLIDDPDLWVHMLKDEYQISGGNCDPATLRRLYGEVKSFYPELCRVYALMAARMNGE